MTPTPKTTLSYTANKSSRSLQAKNLSCAATPHRTQANKRIARHDTARARHTDPGHLATAQFGGEVQGGHVARYKLVDAALVVGQVGSLQIAFEETEVV